MKIHRLSVVIFLSLYSCTTAVQNTNSSSKLDPSPTIMATPSVEIRVSNSPVPEIAPSINSNLDENTISLVVNDEDNIMGKTVTQISTEQGNDYDGQLTLYNMLPNEKKRFRVSLLGSKEVKDENIVWSSSNTDIATIDKNGLVSSTNKSSDKELIGSTVIKASLKIKPEISASFPIILYKALKINSRYKDNGCQDTAIETILSRYQKIDQVNATNRSYDAATINGKVYDTNKNLISGAIVTVKDLRNYYKAMDTINGNYVFRNIPICQDLLLTVSKEGYKTKSRRVLPRSNLNGDTNGNVYHFGGDNLADAIYALEKIEN